MRNINKVIDLDFNVSSNTSESVSVGVLLDTWKEELMMMIIEFEFSFSKNSRIQEYIILSCCKIMFMIYLSCLRNKTYLRNYKEEIEALNTKVTKSHPMLSLNHKVIVTWFCESDVSHIYSSKGVF